MHCLAATLGKVVAQDSSSEVSLVGIPHSFSVPFMSTNSFCFQESATLLQAGAVQPLVQTNSLTAQIVPDSTCPGGSSGSELVGARLIVRSIGAVGLDCSALSQINFTYRRTIASSIVNVLIPTGETSSFSRAFTFLQIACQSESMNTSPPTPWSNILLKTALSDMTPAIYGGYHEYDLTFNSYDDAASFDGLPLEEKFEGVISSCGNGDVVPGGGTIGRSLHNVLTDVDGISRVNETPCKSRRTQRLNVEQCTLPPVVLTMTISPVSGVPMFSSTRDDLSTTSPSPQPISIRDPLLNYLAGPPSSGQYNLTDVMSGVAVVYCSAVPQP